MHYYNRLFIITHYWTCYSLQLWPHARMSPYDSVLVIAILILFSSFDSLFTFSIPIHQAYIPIAVSEDSNITSTLSSRYMYV